MHTIGSGWDIRIATRCKSTDGGTAARSCNIARIVLAVVGSEHGVTVASCCLTTVHVDTQRCIITATVSVYTRCSYNLMGERVVTASDIWHYGGVVGCWFSIGIHISFNS